jgi:hypothetical protein
MLIDERVFDALRWRRATRFGTCRYEFQDAHTEAIASHETSIVVVSSYGSPTFAVAGKLFDKPEGVPPMTITTVAHVVDGVGPDDHPHADTTRFPRTRYWLTW